MKFQDLYNKVLNYWPFELKIGDARLLENGGMRSITLTRAYEDADLRCVTEAESLLNWVIFQHIHKIVKVDSNLTQTQLLLTDTLEILPMKNQYLNALQNDGYEVELEEFLKDNAE